jgi:transcriptional regulator NrdR family protein
MNCPYCNNPARKEGTRKREEGRVQEYRCTICKKYFRTPIGFINHKLNNNIMTEEELRSKYDNKFILRNAVAKLEKGVYTPENEFITNCKIKVSSGYRMAVDSEEFLGFRGVAPGGVVYWSHPESISKMKNEGILK